VLVFTSYSKRQKSESEHKAAQMTTNASSQPSPGRADAAARVCLRAIQISFVVTLVGTASLALLGWASVGSVAMNSVFVAGGILLVVFGPGLPLIFMVSRVSPATTLMVALLTYALQMVVLVAVMQRLSAAAWLDGRLDPIWIGVTLIAIALGCTLALIIVSLRARIPAFSTPTVASAPAPLAGVSQTGTGGAA
jgi:ATP synthase protein I